MIVFEFTENNELGLRILVVGENYRAYEQVDGSVIFNDERGGFTFRPKESYEDFKSKFTLL